MNSKTWTRIVALALFAALTIPAQLAAQDKQDQPHQYHHYQLIGLGTLGGPGNTVDIEPFQNIINRNGTVVGGADTSIPTPEPGCYNPVGNRDCFISHAFVWRSNNLKDLGTLPGGNFSFATAINERGRIAGVSENDQIDPFSGNPAFHAVLWENDGIVDLGTLGGVSSFAESLNNRGQVTGVALNDIPDPFSILGTGDGTSLTQTHGFLWQHGKIIDLGTMGGPDSWAVFVNDHGQVAGASYTSYDVDPLTGTPPVGVFLWQNGKMKDLGNLGGDNGLLGAPGIVNALNNHGEVAGGMVVVGNQTEDAFLWDGEKLVDLGALGGTGSFARGLNDAGDVIGLATLPGDQTNHGFLWRNGTMTDLGTLGGDPCSDALSINSKGQVVGASQSDAGGCNRWTTAFLWENGGPMVDLNVLTLPGWGVHLNAGFWGNDRGEIVAAGNPPGCDNGDICGLTYVLIPCDENHPGVEGCDYSVVDAAAATHERSASAIQTPVTAAPRTGLDFRRPGLTLGPGHSWRSRQGLETRYHRSSPTAANEGSSSEKTSMQSSSCTSGTVISDYLPDGVERPNIPGGSHCSISSQGLLTGYCLGARGGICREAYDPTRCPPSHKAKTPGSWQCGTFGKYHVDLSTSCTP